MDASVYLITALLPLAATMLVSQRNPYRALVIRGILGAVAALVYTVLGAADVALTEALVGTLLAITLYAVAVRSSLVLRVGLLDREAQDLATPDSASASPLQRLIDRLNAVFSPYYLRVEVVPYPDAADLHQALIQQEVHAICTPASPLSPAADPTSAPPQPTHELTTRLRRIYTILDTDLALPAIQLAYCKVSEAKVSQEMKP